MAAQTPKNKAAVAPSRWLFGPATDLLFGCGLAYMIVFVGLAVAGPDVAVWIPASLLPLLAVVAGGPHYGATLLRAYERKEDQRKYQSVTLGATLALAVFFLVSLRLYVLGSFLITLYLLWSPWHYSAQNYGLMLMFLGRRGVAVPPRLKQAVRVSFVLSFLLVIVQLNGVEPVANYAPGVRPTSDGPMAPAYTQMSLGIPAQVQSILFWALVLAYVATLVVIGVGLFRRASPRDLLPALAIVFTQSLWFSLPAIARHGSVSLGLVPLDENFAVYTFHYIAAAHAVQYIWVTLYFDRKTHPNVRRRLFYGKSLFAGSLIWGLPLLLFAPLMNGSFSFSADLALLVAAIVNIHHFVLDGAIWKLRDQKVGGVLVKEATSKSARSELDAGLGARSWAIAIVCLTGAVFAVIQVVGTIESHALGRSLQERDLTRAEQALDRLALVTRDAYNLRRNLGLAATKEGDLDRAIRSFERSVALRPSPGAYFEKGRVHALRQEWDLAADSFEGAYGLAPFPPDYIAQFVNALERAGRRKRAAAVLEAGLKNFPRSPELIRAQQGLEQVNSR